MYSANYILYLMVLSSDLVTSARYPVDEPASTSATRQMAQSNFTKYFPFLMIPLVQSSLSTLKS